jgi:ferredoxin-thioredoxin reductase catalytic chain
MTNSKEKERELLENEIIKWAKDYAEEHGWSLNYDERQLRAVIRGLARNQVRHGERYCPCRIRAGDPETDREIICPCIYHADELSEQGHCHCNLFFDDEFFEDLIKKRLEGPEQPIVPENT